MELVLALSIVRVGRADGRCWNCAKRNRLDDGSCSHCVKSRARAARLYCAVEVASVPVAASGSLLGGLSLAAAGGVCSAGGATSGVDGASDVIGSSSDLMVVLVCSHQPEEMRAGRSALLRPNVGGAGGC